MRRRRAELIAIAAALAACNSGDARQPPAPERCAAELSAWTRAALAEGPGYRAANPLLATERAPAPVPPAPVIRMAPGLILAGDQPIAADAADLPAVLARQLSALRAPPVDADRSTRAAPPPTELRVAAHPETPWSSLVAVARAALAGGFPRLHLLVAAKSAIDAPARPAATNLAGCAPARALAGSAVALDRLAAELPAAIESCGCAAGDLAAARSLIWQRLDRFDGVPVAADSLDLGPGGSPLVLDADTTWAVAERSVARLEGTVILGVAEP